MPVRGRGMCNAARRALSGRFCVRTLLCDCPGRPCGVSSNTRKVSHGSCCHILTPPFQLRLQPVLSDGCTRLSVKNPFCPDGRTDGRSVRSRPDPVVGARPGWNLLSKSTDNLIRESCNQAATIHPDPEPNVNVHVWEQVASKNLEVFE